MPSLTPAEILQLAQFSLDHAEEAAFWTDTEGHLLYANDTACRSLGFTVSELLTLTLFQLSPELTPTLWTHLWKDLQTQEVFTFEMSLKTKDPRGFLSEITARRISLSGRDFLCAFFRDVQERKRLQQLKNEFVSTVSHELRTPMTIIRESVSQVLDGLLGEVPASQKEALYVTLSGIDRLARIINDLLDVSKMEAGKASLRWDRLNLVELVREVIETFSTRAKERGLELCFSLPPGGVVVYADYDRMAQVFTNLVGNALKFTQQGKIEIAVRERDKEIECSVSDTGVGIAREDLGRVFNKFEQLSRPAVTGEKGSGLGLSICKGIVEMHQGRLWAEGRPDQGASFIFTLPKRSAEDLFRQKMSAELSMASATGGYLTAVLFKLKSIFKVDPKSTVTRSHWALNELIETIKTQGARRTDVLVEDSQGVWLGLVGMSKKEANRIMRQILAAYEANLEKNDLAESIRVSAVLCNYPEDVKNAADLMSRLQEEKHAA